MTASFGPRTYLVGCIIQGLLSNPRLDVSIEDLEEGMIGGAIALADKTLEKMQWPNGKPESVSEPPSIGDVDCKHEQIMGGICADCGTDFRGLA